MDPNQQAWMDFAVSRQMEEQADNFAAFKAGVEWANEPHAIGPERREVDGLRAVVLAKTGGAL